MIDELNKWMRMGFDQFSDTRRHGAGRNLVKSYLVEANAPEDVSEAKGLKSFLESLEVSVPIQFYEGDDPTTHTLLIGKDETRFYLDTYDTRFWVFHTTSAASEADSAVQRLVQKTRLLDSMWFPAKYFERWISEAGVPRVMTAKFAVRAGLYRDALPEEEFEDNSLFFKIGSSGNVIERWKRYQESDLLAAKQALWSARVVRRESANRDADFSVADITAAGKVTARGNSFSQHDTFIRHIQASYRQMIIQWEEAFRQQWVDSDLGVKPTGQVAKIHWPERLTTEKLESLLMRLFSGGEPYRLYGVPLQRGENRYVVNAVDLHTGGKLNVEVLPSRLWVHLFHNSCGNVLARLVTNLQHYHDARTELDD